MKMDAEQYIHSKIEPVVSDFVVLGRAEEKLSVLNQFLANPSITLDKETKLLLLSLSRELREPLQLVGYVKADLKNYAKELADEMKTNQE